MINAKELRIGNLLQCAGSDNYFEVTADDLQFIDSGSSKAKPIPLTEDWLLKFGFQQKCVSQTPYCLNGFSIYPNDNNKHCILYYKSVEIIELKSVHQLQNLYFGLTGTELELNETTKTKS